MACKPTGAVFVPEPAEPLPNRPARDGIEGKLAVFQSDWSKALAPRPASVLVVSELLLCREGVASGLERSGAWHVAGAVTTAEAESALTATRADAVLLDVSLPRALAVAARLREAAPEVAIVGFGLGETV